MGGTLGSRIQSMGQVLSKRLDTRLLLLVRPSSLDCILFRGHPFLTASLAIFLLFFYVGIPVWFYFCPWIRRHAVFLNKADWPFQDFAHPESYGLSCAHNFYIEAAPGVVLGVWHILPTSLHHFCKNSSWTLQNYSFQCDNRPIVLYLHGSAESRTAAYRRSLYKVLSSQPLDFHVITFDYRGFGDSTSVTPTASTVVEDAEAVYEWLKTKVPLSRIYLWGHSLGSGVAVQLGEKTSVRGDNPFAIILEAPFASVADTTHTFPLSFFHRHLPFFQKFCSDRTRHGDTNFDNYSRIGNLTTPLLILHAADDSMVWSEQGKRLWLKSVEERPSSLPLPIFVELDSKYGCGHRNIHREPHLPDTILNFLHGIT